MAREHQTFFCFYVLWRKHKGRVKEWGRMDEEGSGETKEEEDWVLFLLFKVCSSFSTPLFFGHYIFLSVSFSCLLISFLIFLSSFSVSYSILFSLDFFFLFYSFFLSFYFIFLFYFNFFMIFCSLPFFTYSLFLFSTFILIPIICFCVTV